MSSCLAVWNLEATGVANFVSGDGIVRIATLEGGRVDSSGFFSCWHQEVFWRHGLDVALNKIIL